MWKLRIDRILEACACMDATAYMYYVTAKRESELRADEERMGSRSANAPILRLAEGHQAPREARA